MPKQRTTEDVYYRLIHDGERFETENVLIGYMDRIRGSMEMKFASFQPIRDGGEIPFHRLRYFRSPRGLLYDRTSGIDCVFECSRHGVESGHGIPPIETIETAIKEAKWNREIVEYNAVQRQKRKKQRWQSSNQSKSKSGGKTSTSSNCQHYTIPIYSCNESGDWEIHDNEGILIENKISFENNLKVVSFNVLFDRFDEEMNPEQTVLRTVLRTERWSALLDHIKDLKAHIICFQECTPCFVELVLNTSWVKHHYFSTASPNDLSTITPDGQLLLTTFPVARAIRHNFSKSKSVLLAELDLLGRRLIVPCLHLTSDYRGGRSTQRNEQLATILDICRIWDDEEDLDILLVGDFNCAYEEEDIEVLSSLKGHVDVWRHVWPEDPGFTFDPLSNRLAAVEHANDRKDHVSTSKRCDRMFLSSLTNWVPFSAALINVEVTGPERSYEGPLSDHNGLVFEFCAISTPSSLAAEEKEEESLNIPWQPQVSASTFLVDGGDTAFASWRVVANRALRVVRLAVSEECALVEIGAGTLSVALPFSDVDIVVIGSNNNAKIFLQCLADALGTMEELIGADIRLVNASVMPCVRVSESTHLPALDIQYVDSPKLLQEFNLESGVPQVVTRRCAVEVTGSALDNEVTGGAEERINSSSNKDDRSLEAIRDSDMLLKRVLTSNSKVPKQCLLKVFRRTTRCVKVWAKRRGIYGTSFGFPGGFALSVLVAAFMNKEAPKWTPPQVDADHFHVTVLGGFFDFYSKFSWDQFAVDIEEKSGVSSLLPQSNMLPMTVLTPLRRRNSCRSSTRTTLQIFQRELAQTAISLSNETSPSTFLLPQVKEFLASSVHFLCLEVLGDDTSKVAEGLGFLESRIVPLLVSLSQSESDLGVRPWSSTFMSDKGWRSPIENGEGLGEVSGFILFAISSQATLNDSLDLSEESIQSKTLQHCLNDNVGSFFQKAFGHHANITYRDEVVERSRIIKI